MFQTQDAKTVITDPSQSGHLASQKRPLASASAEVAGQRRIPNCIFLADAPALSFFAGAPAKLEPGTFRLPMPSRAQVKSQLKPKLFQGTKVSKKCYSGSRLHSTELRKALLPP